ncbi:hypothetical protein [Peribacillus acanthi]|uniref:hypothetical protein n=1 Tax=Peribacillus acanthi TaxID=2171554 RepID=UPI000D3E4258|nr:hypothetical protein [Peribacillus acanthi]
MKKRELTKIFAGFLFSAAVLTGCNSSDEVEKKEETKQETTKEESKAEEKVAFDINATSSAKEVGAYLAIKQELEKMKENQPVDWDMAIEKYSSELKNPINEVSSEFQQATEVALNSGKSGELDQHLARQLFDKSVQSYFYQKQKTLQKDAAAKLAEGDVEAATAAFEEIKHLSTEVFIPTATKRDEYYQLTGEASMVENINAGLAAQEEALTNNKPEDFDLYIQLTDKSIYKSYYLAANSYGEKIAQGVTEGKTEEELKQMQAEAWGFFQAIKGSLSGGDEAAAMKLDQLFALDQTQVKAINAEEVNSLFTKAINGKIKGYHEKVNAAASAGKIAEAKVEALEANMFMKMLELNIQSKLGEEKANEAFAQAEQWFNAVSENNPEEAKSASEAVLSVLAGL